MHDGASGSGLGLLCLTHPLADLSSLRVFSTAYMYPDNPIFPSPAQPSRDTSVCLANLSTGFSNRYLTLNMSKIQLYSSFPPQSPSLSQQQLYPSNCLESSSMSFTPHRRAGIFFLLL